ncbi:MAG: prepilin peptidase [Acidobacteria bacterium]|nr:prepilin peptidase [Acidobacteriota bacterium]
MMILVFVAFGLVVGSFLNVCICRVPEGRSIVAPRSACPRCRRPIAFYDNIPLLSYAILRGRCRHCRERISAQYPLVEAVNAAFWGVIAAWAGLTPASPPMDICGAVVYAAFCSAMLTLAVIDARHRILPHGITFGGLLLGLATVPLQPMHLARAPEIQRAAVILDWPVPSDLTAAYVHSLLGFLSGAGLLATVAIGYYLVKRKEGMGHGDIVMMGFVGVVLGWRLTFLTIFFGSVLGIAGWYLLSNRDRNYELPFGTFLALGAVAALLAGNPFLDWYLGMLHG